MSQQRADGYVRHQPRREPVASTYIHRGREYRRRDRRRVVCPCGFDKTYNTERGAAVGDRRHGQLPPYLPGVYVPSTTLTPEQAVTKVLEALGESASVLEMLRDPTARAVLEDTVLWAAVPDLLRDIRDQGVALLNDLNQPPDHPAPDGETSGHATRTLPDPGSLSAIAANRSS